MRKYLHICARQNEIDGSDWFIDKMRVCYCEYFHGKIWFFISSYSPW